MPYNETEQESIEGVLSAQENEDDRAFATVYAEVERLANRKAGWSGGIIILLITFALFMGMGIKDFSWKPLVVIVGVLFFHELGHFAAMSIFGYRNLRMFFIPFLGAAVTGQNYNVPGWKKAIVSLAGPVPGIILGIVVAVLSLYFHWNIALYVSIMLLSINAFNLLPFMPLDGGQLMHAVLFSRHTAIDVVFRAVAAVALILSWFIGFRVLAILGGVMLMGLSMHYRVAKIVRGLRERGFDATSSDGQTIPIETARVIYDELQQAVPAKMSAKAAATWTLNAFELLNARPPGWLASAALIFVQGFSFFIALAAVVIIFAARH